MNMNYFAVNLKLIKHCKKKKKKKANTQQILSVIPALILKVQK